MAAATVDTVSPAHGSGTAGVSQRPSMTSVGTIIWLSSELMFFSALFAIYFTIRASSSVWPPADEHPHVGYSAIFTVILVASSLTCQLGVFAAEKGDVYKLRLWYVITLLMGLTFVLGQANEYRNLVHEHLTFSHDAYMSCFFLTTGFHFLHVCGGLFAFVIVLARSTIGKFTPARATSAIVTSYYWHFVDVVWIGLYVAIYLIQ